MSRTWWDVLVDIRNGVGVPTEEFNQSLSDFHAAGKEAAKAPEQAACRDCGQLIIEPDGSCWVCEL